MRARGVIITVLLILALTLVALNTEVISFKLWFWDLQPAPITSFLAGSLLVGVVMGLLLGRPWKRIKKASSKKNISVATKPEDGMGK